MNAYVFEVDPIEQWLELIHEPLRGRPWCVAINGYVRAEFRSKRRAQALVNTLRAEWHRALPKRSNG